MKILRFMDGQTPGFGILEGGTVYRANGDLYAGSLTKGDAVGSIDSVEVLVPVTPRKIVAVGKNYSDHIAEMAQSGDASIPEEPVLFLKPPTGSVGERW